MNRISVFYEHMAEAMKQENITLTVWSSTRTASKTRAM